MKPDQPHGMTSREAAALYLSDGQTDDPGLASMMDYAKKQPELLIPKGYVGMVDYEAPKLVIDDPDVTDRIALRNALGFDFTVDLQDKRAVVHATGTNLKTIAKLVNDYPTDSAAVSAAVMRLKTKVDRI